MKIDLYNNHKQYIAEQRQDWNIGRWLKTHGVTVADLDSHKQINDVVLLINIRQQYWHAMSSSEQASWGGYWNVVYRNSKPLKPKALNRFETIIQQIDQRKLKINILKQVNQLKTGSAIQNKDVHNKANPSCLPPVTDTKREQQECHTVPTADDVPWW
jgi:hypothetical protein